MPMNNFFYGKDGNGQPVMLRQNPHPQFGGQFHQQQFDAAFASSPQMANARPGNMPLYEQQQHASMISQQQMGKPYFGQAPPNFAGNQMNTSHVVNQVSQQRVPASRLFFSEDQGFCLVGRLLPCHGKQECYSVLSAPWQCLSPTRLPLPRLGSRRGGKSSGADKRGT